MHYCRHASRMGVSNLERTEKIERRKNRNQDNDTAVGIVCAMCVVGYVDQQSASTKPTDSPSLNFLIIIISDESDHHTRSRGIAGERGGRCEERGRVPLQKTQSCLVALSHTLGLLSGGFFFSLLILPR